MMTIKKTASSNWSGDIKSGKGTISTQSGALDNQPYGFNTRFEDKPVGAAHSACFSMALSLALGEAGFTADDISTKATVSLDEVDDGFAVSEIELVVNAKITDISNEQFQALCEDTKKGCPISKLLNTSIKLTATLN